MEERERYGAKGGARRYLPSWTTLRVVITAFAYYTVESYSSGSLLYFIYNYSMTILFFFACYFSIKTLRGYLVPEKNSCILP